MSDTIEIVSRTYKKEIDLNDFFRILFQIEYAKNTD